MNRLRLRAEGGFTLIELLVVIAIIGILAAIAIPQFAAYRRRGFASQAQSDLRNVATAQEAYFVDFNHYQSGAMTSGSPPGFNPTNNVTTTATDGTSTFTLTAVHASCAAGADTWTYSSATGVITAVGGACG